MTADVTILASGDTVKGRISYISERPQLSSGPVGQGDSASSLSLYNVIMTFDTQEGIVNGYHTQATIEVNTDKHKVPTKAIVNDGNEIMMITNEGIVIRMFVDDISILGRVTLGVKLMNTGDKDDIVVASITKVKESVTEADALEAARLSEENETLAEGSEELSEDSDSEDN